LIGGTACSLSFHLVATVAHAQSGPIKVGLMLPSGTYAALGNAIENGFTLNS